MHQFIEYDGGIPVDDTTRPSREMVCKVRVGLARHRADQVARLVPQPSEPAADTSPIESMGETGAQ